jgi:hypothetical protein
MRSLLAASQQALRASARAYSAAATPDRKVAILGAAGGIGQPLGLLMKVFSWLHCRLNHACTSHWLFVFLAYDSMGSAGS